MTNETYEAILTHLEARIEEDKAKIETMGGLELIKFARYCDTKILEAMNNFNNEKHVYWNRLKNHTVRCKIQWLDKHK